MTIQLKQGETVLQIPNFPNQLKKEVQAKLMLETNNVSLKQFTIELYRAYLSGVIPDILKENLKKEISKGR